MSKSVFHYPLGLCFWALLTSVLTSGILHGDVGVVSNQEGEELFLEGYEEAREWMKDGKWSEARDRILSLLDEHEKQRYVILRRTEIIEDLERCAVRMAIPRPDLKTLLEGRYQSYNSKTGKIKLRYLPGRLPDFEQQENGILIHPLTFAGNYSVLIEGDYYSVEKDKIWVRSLGIIACLQGDQYFMVIPGLLESGKYTETIVPTKIVHVVAGQTEIVERAKKSPVKLKDEYRITIQVSSRNISVSYNRKKILSAKKPKGLWGQIGFAHLPRFSKIEIQGKANSSWIMGLLDESTREAEKAFLKTYDAAKEIPEWLLPDQETRAALDEPKMETLPWKLEKNQAKYFKRMNELMKNDSGKEIFDYLRELPKGALPPEMFQYFLAIGYLKDGQFHNALQLIRKVCGRNPEFLQSKFLHAQLLSRVGSLKEAVMKYAELIEAAPDRVDGYRGLIETLLLDGNVGGAREIIFKAREAGMRHPEFDQAETIIIKAERGPNWRRVYPFETEHYEVISNINRKTCANAAHDLEEIYDLLVKELGNPPSYKKKYKVYLFSGRVGYSTYASDLFDDPAHCTAGLYSKSLKQLLIWNLPNRDDMIHTVRHEGVHQYLNSMGFNGPTWFEEGLAEYNSYVHTNSAGKAIRTGAVPGIHVRFLNRHLNQLVPLKYFILLHGDIFYKRMELSYPQAWAFVYFLKNCDKVPPQIYEKLMKGSRDGLGAKECIDSAFKGVNYNEMDKNFKDFIQNLDG